MTPLKLAIVAPCYNEEEVLPLSAPRLVALIDSLVEARRIAPDSFLLFVDDGSRDRTWEIIAKFNAENSMCHGLALSRNVGHQNAIMAGMSEAVNLPDAADAVITIDVDLQDSLDCIPKMIDACYDGADVVYGVRDSRESDSFLKRFSAESFYKFQAALGVKTIYNHADFRFMTRRVILELERYGERNLYLRGIIPMIGFPSATVNEARQAREAGKTKYTLRKMLTLGFDGITSFSITPIHWILALGGIFVLISIAIGIYVLVSLLTGSAVHGWSSLILSVWFVGGAIMLAVGLVGLYVGKIYIETKQRPRYHIRSHLR